jgi:N-acetylglucosaminyl-diphospho-decaprenol L-rhamnosyltransferase
MSGSPVVDVSIIIVSYNTAYLLREAVGKVKSASHGLKVECIFVDNASSDESVVLIQREFPSDTLIINDTNVGFGRANNQALTVATGRYILLLNTDAFVASDTLTKTLAYMDTHPRCGILGVRLEGRDGALQPCARYFPTPFNQFLQRTGLHKVFRNVRLIDDMGWDHATERHCDWVVGCYYLVRKDVIDQVGLFDPRYFLYFEEVDHCFAAKNAGWEVVFYPHTTVVHLGGESAKSSGEITASGRQLSALQVESELLYFRKNHGLLGVCSDVLLSLGADFVHASKQFLKGRGVVGASAAWKHAVLLLKLCGQTRLGTRPTR